jgi:hypothetical protein
MESDNGQDLLYRAIWSPPDFSPDKDRRVRNDMDSGLQLETAFFKN